MKIREANLEDAKAISELISGLTEKFIVPDCSESGEQILLESMTPDSIKKYMKSDYRYHVGERNERVIGVVATKGNSHLYHLFITESEQGKGYSKQLWDIAREACIAAGNNNNFTVNSSPNAQSIYKNWGFVPTQKCRETNGIVDIPMRLKVGS